MAPSSIHETGAPYVWEVKPSEPLADPPGWLVDLLRGSRGSERPKPAPLAPGELILEGARNDRLFRLAASLRGKGLSEAAIKAALLEENKERCDPPLSEREVERIAASSGRYPGGTSIIASTAYSPPPRVWPELPPEVLHGLAGEVVRTIDPHTEADPAAILFQFLVAFGNVIGRSAHFRVEADEHPGNLFAVLLGESAKGRKGTSWGHIKRLLRSTDEAWTLGRVVSGLSSGEGLKYHVRDPRTEKQPIKEKGRVTGYQEVEADAGVNDKRLLVVEAEYASTLRVLQREGNTLSPVIRCAWDDGNLRTLTKSDPTTATGAHVSIIGHCTNHELLRYLDSTEAGNGFANRFLWVCARRSKELPEGGELHKVDLAPILHRLKAAVDFAVQVGELRRDEAARALWREIYSDLSAGRPGLYGAVTARGEAQVVRLSLLYALADCSPVIREEHLLAALGAWAYCDTSARYVFGTATGDRVADRIEAELRARPEGLTRDEIRDLFARNQTSERISQALELLHTAGRAVPLQEKGDRGRPVERWIAAQATR
ncbi:MAG: primase C-terminal domain-containing protein [Proteobacteria bacterium]|nr:primase C-terminal domain-containing protein [Pseudomonadota bacterium]